MVNVRQSLKGFFTPLLLAFAFQGSAFLIHREVEGDQGEAGGDHSQAEGDAGPLYG